LKVAGCAQMRCIALEEAPIELLGDMRCVFKGQNSAIPESQTKGDT